MAKPTLALIPAAQGSKFYSVLPSNGVGDFNFTRSGSATRINKDGLIETVSSGVSRLNYPLIDGVVKGCPSHLLEPQTTNLIQYSEDFSNAYWSKIRATITSNQIISPDGTLNADLLTITDTSENYVQTNVPLSVSGTKQTVSCFVKKGTNNFAHILIWDTSSNGSRQWFDLENGIVGSSTSFGSGVSVSSASIESYGNGWYRCVVVFNSSFSSVRTRVSASNGDGQTNGTIGKTIYIWGYQCEANSSYATSYILTQGAISTRSAETVAGSGDASTFNSQSGALFGEFKTEPDGGNFLISISENNNNSGAVFIGADASENIYTYYNSANHVSNINSYDSFNKVCISWGSDGVKIYINGLSKTVLGSQALSTSNYNNIKFSRANTSLKFLGQIKDLRVYKTALTDQELQTLTTI